jgi:hypothetical protein
MRIFRAGLLACVAIATVSVFGQNLTPEQIQLQQQLVALPPPPILQVSQKLAARGKPHSISVPLVLNADLDGSGAFRYFIALFAIEDDPGGFVRVFKQQDGSLEVAGDQDVDRQVGGWGVEMELVDVDGDGIPEVKVTSISHDARDQYFSLFSWTGSSLHDMVGNVVGNGALEDIDGDGIMEIFTSSPGGNGFDIFKLSGNTYRYLKTVPQDPSGLSRPDGKLNYVRALCNALDPDRFPLPEIRRALAGKPKDTEDEDGDKVQLTFGGLERVNSGPVPVEKVDTTTVAVAPRLTPIRVSIRPARAEDRERERGHDRDKDRDEICEKDHDRISVEIERTDFLKALQRLHLDGPLAAGDSVEVRLTARLKDGTPVGAVFTAKIVADSGKDTDKGKDHKGN